MFKRLLMVMIVGGAFYAAWHAMNPEPVSADVATTASADSTAPADTGIRARIEAKLGQLTTSVAGGQIRASIEKTEREIAILQPLVRRTGGSSGRNADEVSKRIWALDSLSLASLDAAHPVEAIRHAMDARGYIDMVRGDVSDESAAR